MPEPDQHEIPFEERRFKNHKLRRRGIFLLPSLFTTANLLCGYYAVVAALLGTTDDFDRAAKAIGFAILFDSLADVVSFGIAPAVVAYAWGVRSLAIAGTPRGQLLSDMGWVCCLIFLVCCAWRLARFNVQGMAPGGSKYFVGMPTPAAAGVIAALVHGFKV